MFKVYCTALCVIWYMEGMTRSMTIIAALVFGLLGILQEVVDVWHNKKL